MTGTLSDFAINLVPTTVAAMATLRFRGVNTIGSVTHNLSLRYGATELCGAPGTWAASNMAETFTVTNLQPGSYVIYCSRHPGLMNEPLTVS